MLEDLRVIKKLYGEKMCHFCRDFFSSILEEQGKLSKILQDNFAPSHDLFEDIIDQERLEDFKDYVYNLFYKKEKKKESNIISTPKKLLSQVGYTLYECKTEEDIQAFKKYYAKGEELCTLRGGRLNSCYVFFAVKENATEINRSNFTSPKRQDEYGTSVISIQFSKDQSHTLSIKNRYNHTVSNPDATFGNDLEQIIPGLTDSFEREYGLVQSHKSQGLELLNYVKANDGRFYKFNYEYNNINYCPNNVIIDNGIVKHFAKDRYIIVDFYIIDLVEKRIYLYDENFQDSFPKVISQIEKINIVRASDGKKIEIIHKDGEITAIKIDKQNRITELKSGEIIDANDCFLWLNRTITTISLPNLRTVGKEFVEYSSVLNEIYVPKLEKVGTDFLRFNEKLESFEAPNLIQVGHNFLYGNTELESLKIPKLVSVGNRFLFSNDLIDELDLPMLESTGEGFLFSNNKLKTIVLPSLRYVGNSFLYSNRVIAVAYFPNLEIIEAAFLFNNRYLINLNLPNAKIIEECFLQNNTALCEFNAPKLQRVGSSFMKFNHDLKSLSLPSLVEVQDDFILGNTALIKIHFPKLQTIGNYFLYYNFNIKDINMESLKEVGDGFLPSAENPSLFMPRLRKVGADFLTKYLNRNKVLEDVEKNSSLDIRK